MAKQKKPKEGDRVMVIEGEQEIEGVVDQLLSSQFVYVDTTGFRRMCSFGGPWFKSKKPFTPPNGEAFELDPDLVNSEPFDPGKL